MKESKGLPLGVIPMVHHELVAALMIRPEFTGLPLEEQWAYAETTMLALGYELHTPTLRTAIRSAGGQVYPLVTGSLEAPQNACIEPAKARNGCGEEIRPDGRCAYCEVMRRPPSKNYREVRRAVPLNRQAHWEQMIRDKHGVKWEAFKHPKKKVREWLPKEEWARRRQASRKSFRKRNLARFLDGQVIDRASVPTDKLVSRFTRLLKLTQKESSQLLGCSITEIQKLSSGYPKAWITKEQRKRMRATLRAFSERIREVSLYIDILEELAVREMDLLRYNSSGRSRQRSFTKLPPGYFGFARGPEDEEIHVKELED